jgi:hypothetical protein
VFFGGRLLRLYARVFIERKLLKYLSADYPFRFNSEYDKNCNSLLNILCDKYGSDKGETTSDGKPYGWQSHTYTDYYELLFQLRRKDVESVIECGIGTNNPELTSTMGVKGKPGASLRVWRDYFPNANIIGIDIDADILFEEDRIKTYQCDQTSKSSIEDFIDRSCVNEKTVDVIIDDGLHEFHAGVSLFEGLNKCFADDGVYIIEDISKASYLLYKEYFAKIKSQYTVRFVNLQRPNLQIGNNRLIIITRVL